MGEVKAPTDLQTSTVYKHLKQYFEIGVALKLMLISLKIIFIVRL